MYDSQWIQIHDCVGNMQNIQNNWNLYSRGVLHAVQIIIVVQGVPLRSWTNCLLHSTHKEHQKSQLRISAHATKLHLDLTMLNEFKIQRLMYTGALSYIFQIWIHWEEEWLANEAIAQNPVQPQEFISIKTLNIGLQIDSMSPVTLLRMDPCPNSQTDLPWTNENKTRMWCDHPFPEHPIWTIEWVMLTQNDVSKNTYVSFLFDSHWFACFSQSFCHIPFTTQRFSNMQGAPPRGWVGLRCVKQHPPPPETPGIPAGYSRMLVS